MKSGAATSQIYAFGEFRLDPEEHLLHRRDEPPIPLTPRVFATLRYLVEHPGRIAEKQALMDAVWPDCIVEENNLAQTISTLRRLLGDKNGTQHYIATVPGRGYRFLAEVKTTDSVDSPAAAVAPAPSLEARLPAPSRLRRTGALALVLAVLLALVAVAFFYWPRPTPTPVPDKSIAVLPFVNLSGDPDNAYFAEGIKDEILTRLSRVAVLKVISRTSTQEFADKPHNVRDIARRLGVAHIVEGSVQKSGETVRVTVQLIHAPSDTHLWAESYDRKLEDMFLVETEIAQRIASALAARLTGAEKQALASRPTSNLDAYHEYLQGRYFWNKRTPDGFREAVPHLSRALQLDPGYAQAQVGLADAVIFRGGTSLAAQDEAMKNGRALLQQALALDETLADAHASLGLFAMNYDWDWPLAEKEFKRALELNSNYATAHHWYGEFLAYMGRFDEAVAEIQRARELDPLSLIINTDVAKVLCLARRYDEAIAQFQATLRLDPDFAEAHALMGFVLSKQGRHDEAVAEFRKIKNLESNAAYLCWLGYAYGNAGRMDEARQIIDQVNELSRSTYVSPLWTATFWTGVGDHDEAFRAFERVLAERPSGGPVSLKVNPLFDSLRADLRYAELLRRANFVP